MAGMGQAVMGTAVRSGPNRAKEAAQAAMASPLLEAGAIDGARGILINITGSSSLKLSEVNEASSIIQCAAHEDANIIFGAVQSEEMGDDVKITVIATGFRDQMPERRARMLSVEDTPVISVPVVAPDNWLNEPAVHIASEPSAPVKPRFMSEEDEDLDTGETADEAFFFSSSAPAVATTVTVAPSQMLPEPEEQFMASVARMQYVEVAAEPADPRFSMDFGPDFPAAPRAQAEPMEVGDPASAALFSEPSEQQERDLDVPAFMRRAQF